MKKELGTLLTTITAFLITGLVGFLFNFFFFDYQDLKASVRIASVQFERIDKSLEEIKDTQKAIMHLLSRRPR